jgi:hypothetical protein
LLLQNAETNSIQPENLSTLGARARARLRASQTSHRFPEEASMGDVINLKRFKKRSEREQSARQADANRARFGRTKSERNLEQQRAERAGDLLDQHRIDGEDAS